MTPVMEKVDRILIRFGYDKPTRLGFFLFLGWSSLVGRPEETHDNIIKRLNLYPHCDINNEYRGLLEQIDFARVHNIYDELVWRLDTDITARNISNIEGVELSEFNFKNYHLLDDDDQKIVKLGDSEYLFSEAMRQFGLVMEAAEFGPVQAFKSGMCLANIRCQYDVEASRWSVAHIRKKLPLIFHAADFISYNPDAYGEGYLATQIPLQVFLNGTPSEFGQLCWYYQSWILFKDQLPIPGVEAMPIYDFMNWCYDRAKAFFQAFYDKIIEVTATYENTSLFPAFKSDVDERPLIIKALNEHYGDFDADRTTSDPIVRALIIFGYFCSLCETTVAQAGLRPIQ
ncbi:hypothetical protein [Marivivens sp. JLT3646]|uniref:hypothetical protein n=1 Tax=Marivivens sp. JLT3646 TaxID=1920883 RepID=UPI0008013B5D|nr:hypothetical protein [Marivivens sp. JLT3646]APO85841.1 hypothetical protein BSK21_01555 [Marivivens sp. JLT3646]OBR37067.1 hypothetical protein A9199_06985 [Donghicola sp. JL3646]